MKIEGYEEISEDEFWKLGDGKGLSVNDYYTDKSHYYKKAQKFPMIFEDDDERIEVGRTDIVIKEKRDKDMIYFRYAGNFPLLKQAMKKIDELGLDKKRGYEEE